MHLVDLTNQLALTPTLITQITQLKTIILSQIEGQLTKEISQVTIKAQKIVIKVKEVAIKTNQIIQAAISSIK